MCIYIKIIYPKNLAIAPGIYRGWGYRNILLGKMDSVAHSLVLPFKQKKLSAFRARYQLHIPIKYCTYLFVLNISISFVIY